MSHRTTDLKDTLLEGHRVLLFCFACFLISRAKESSVNKTKTRKAQKAPTELGRIQALRVEGLSLIIYFRG